MTTKEKQVAELERQYLKGLITPYELELRKMSATGQMTEEQAQNILDLIYSDMNHNFVSKDRYDFLADMAEKLTTWRRS